MAVKGDTISDLPGVGNPATELPGGLFEVEVLTGPVAGAYVNKHLTAEQLATYLGAGTGGGGGTIDAYTKAQTNILLSFKLNADKLGQSLTRTDAIAAIAPHNGLTAGASYIVTGTWNGIPNSGVALLAGSIDNFNPVGYITISNNAVAVVADVRAGTYQLLSDLLTQGVTELQISSQQGQRTAVVKLIEPLTLLAITVLAANNVQSYALQVNRYQGGSWVAGTPRAALSTAQADLNALVTADYTAGAELEITTVPVDTAAEAILILSFRA